jgi:hypothetical protein
MVIVPGLGCKQYRERMDGGDVPAVSCPDPACGETLLRGHGSYARYLGGELQRVRRLRCRRCGVSHALLPEDVSAYRDASLDDVEAALAAGTPAAGAQAASQAGERGVRRVRSWLRSTERSVAVGVQALLAAEEGPWWRRAQRVVGLQAGWLTRLRHWLWSRYRVLLGGVSGLYRHGRNERRPQGPSPYLGNCPSQESGAKLCREASR